MTLMLPQKEWRGRSRLTAKDNAPWVGPWQWDSTKSGFVASLEATYKAALEIHDAVAEKRNALTGSLMHSNRHTPEGAQAEIKEQLAAFVAKEIAPKAQQLAAKMETAKAEIQTRRAAVKLNLPPIDPSDAAGAIRRMELRNHVRNMDKNRLGPLLLGKERNLEILAAVLELPDTTGVAPSMVAAARDSLLREQYGPVLDELDELEDALGTAAHAANVAVQDVQISTGVNPLLAAA